MITGNFKDNAEWIYQALTMQLGLGLFYTQWRAILAILAPIFRSALEKFLASLVPDDKEWIVSLFNHRAWRILRAVCVGISGISLPSAETFNTIIAARRIKNIDNNSN